MPLPESRSTTRADCISPDTRNNRILRQDAADSMNFSVVADNSLGIGLPARPDRGQFWQDLRYQQRSPIKCCKSLRRITTSRGKNNCRHGRGGPFPVMVETAGQARLNLPNPSLNELQVTAEIIALSNGVLVFTDTNNQRVRLMVRLANLPSPLPVVTVSGASFTTQVASESIVSAFGSALAVVDERSNFFAAADKPCRTTIKVKDSNNDTRDAPMFFAYSGQINYLIPTGTKTGPATVTITSADGQVSIGTVNIDPVAPAASSRPTPTGKACQQPCATLHLRFH